MKMEHCIANCTETHQICLETVSYCLGKGGKHAEAKHLRLLLDCAQICTTSADYMIRKSEMHGRTCGLCADVCKRCAEACDAFGDDPQMKRCAEACRRCVQSCREMADHA